MGSATPGPRKHFKARIGGLPPDFSSRAGTQAQNGPFRHLIRGRFAAFLHIAFSFSLATESSVGGSHAHTFYSQLNLPSFHPFCFSVPGSSGFQDSLGT